MLAKPKTVYSEDLSARFASVRSFTESLCEPLETEDYIPQPIADVSPVKWNIAHTTWFFEEMILKNFVPKYSEYNKDFGFLFNSYYNSIGERTQRANRGDLSRPTVREVFAYRHFVDKAMLEFLSGEIPEGVRDLVELGLNHEQQHQELLVADLKYMLSMNPLFPAYRENYAPVEVAGSGIENFIEMPAGQYGIGHEGDTFSFDNELQRHTVHLEDFTICSQLVTNRQYLEFVSDGGYRNADLWHSDGWDWVTSNRIESPNYWHNKDGQLRHFTLGGLRRMWPEAPVCHISWYEASAFAAWIGGRLPTEFEWEAASSLFEWGLRWEWTNSAYLPYPGYRKPAGAVGEYNGKFMVNQMVLRGASVVTPPSHSRKTYRNFFQPNVWWQFSGIRLAR
ncbi:MAG: ergothioneine biosynthesis protein EgtB [Pyrinomonadaceae bacterium]